MSSPTTPATTHKPLLCARLTRCSLGPCGLWRRRQAQSSAGLLSPAWAGQQQNSKKTCGQCTRDEECASADHDALPFPLYWYHLPRPGTGAVPGSLPWEPLSHQLCYLSAVWLVYLPHASVSPSVKWGQNICKNQRISICKVVRRCLTQSSYSIMLAITIIVIITIVMSMGSALNQDIICSCVGGCLGKALAWCISVLITASTSTCTELGLKAYLIKTSERRNTPATKPYMSTTWTETYFYLIFGCDER